MGRKKIKSSIYYPSARVHHLTVFMYDKDGNMVMPESKIRECLAKHDGGYLKYAYILHDKDVYDAEAVYTYQEKNRKTYIDRYQILAELSNLEKDETSETGYVHNEEIETKARTYADEQFPLVEREQKKPAHWHIILHFQINRPIDQIARWFDLEPNWDEVKLGRGALENSLNYLVHAKDPRKYQYDSSEVRASFDYATELEERLQLDEQHEKYHIETDTLNDVLEDVAERGLSLRDAQSRVSMAVYLRNKRLFTDARAEYVKYKAPMPFVRQVFYIESEGLDDDHGKGGLGKTACAKAFAKQLAKEFGGDPAFGIDQLQEYIYWAGDAKVFLQQYDAQPILVIDEINGTDMKRALKGVNGVKSLLDPFPERKSLDKKHGDVVCVAKYIIINGIQSFDKFKRDLAGEMVVDGVVQASEESVKEQFDRRFWGNIRIIDASQIEFWLNRGLFDNTPERDIMTMVGRVRANFQQLNSLTTGEAQARIEERILEPVTSQVQKANETHAQRQKITNPDDLTEDLLRMGEIIEVMPDGKVEITQQNLFDDGFLKVDPNEVLPFD